MSPTQIPNPQREMPDYVLRCTDSVTLDGLVAVGRFYGPDYLRNRWWCPRSWPFPCAAPA